MAVGVNLSRNTKVYYTTNTDVTGYGDHNTVELQVLNGYTFTQGSDQQTIQIAEAGANPNRGQRSFNTKLNPVDWKFSTYIRPRYNTALGSGVITAASGTSIIPVLTAGVVTHNYVHATVTGSITSSGFYKIAGFTGNSTDCNSTTPVPVARWGSNTICRFSVPLSVAAATCTGAATFTPVAVNTCAENVLWNALSGAVDVFQTGNKGAAWAHGTTTGQADTAAGILTTTASNVHQLAPFALIFKIDTVYYKVSNCSLNSAEVNFGIDQIAQVAWSGFGVSYTTVAAAGTAELAASVTAYDSTAQFITNKLSVVSIAKGAGGAFGKTNGAVTADTAYSVPITGGTISINNNLTYLTPEVIGVVNQPIGYFTGTKAVSGNMTAYLRTGGTTETSDLLTAIIAGAATTADNQYSMIVNMGGLGYPHVEYQFNGAMVQIPSVDVQDVVSTTLNFTAQGTLAPATYPALFDITASNEYKVRYLAA